MIKLVHALTLVLELHCMAGFRDPHFASVKPVPLKAVLEDLDESYDGRAVALLSWRDKGVGCSMWMMLNEEDASRVKVGKTYSLVKSRSIRHADPYTITKAREE